MSYNKNKTLYLLIFLIVFSFSSCSQEPREGKPVAITNAVLIDGNGGVPIEHSTVIIVDGKIEAAGSSESIEIPDGAYVIDAEGKTVMPGLADMHVHMCGGWDGVSVDILGYQRYLNSLLYAGVTTVLDMGNIVPFSLQMRQEINAGRIKGPRIITAGPLIDGPDPIWPPITYSVSSMEIIPKFVKQLKNQGVDFIKAYAGLTEEMVKKLVTEAHKEELQVFIHKPPGLSMEKLLKTGIDAIAHMPSRELSEEIIRLMKNNCVACITTLAVTEVGGLQRFNNKSFLDHSLITDATPPWFMEKVRALEPKQKRPTKRLQTALVNTKKLLDSGILIAAGTDAPYPGVFQGEGIHHELELLVEAGLSPLQAISAATKNAALLVKAGDRWGTIAPGMSADLIIVSGRPDKNIADTKNVETVIQSGRVINRESLTFDFTKDPGFRVATSVSATQ